MRDWFWTLFVVVLVLVMLATTYQLSYSIGYEAGRHDSVVSKVDSINEMIDRRCR